MKYTLKRSNDYLIKNAGRINKQYRLRYHFSPPIGWMNDPNGVCYYRGAMHVFYQYYPYDSCWGPMHWGHTCTEDNCIFSHCKVALAPDRKDEHGCFSGGAVVDKDNDKKLLLLYTKNYEDSNGRVETQGLASSVDGFLFSKRRRPVIGADDIPEGIPKENFRDPNPVVIGNEYFVFIGSRSDKGEGLILVYSSSDGETFRYRNKICSSYLGKMGECPDFFSLGEKDVLLASVIGIKAEENRFRNKNVSLYFVGKFDTETCDFAIEYVDEIDSGHDFYAPQTCLDGRGCRVMVAWMEMWKEEYFLHKFHHGYNGALIYPRILTMRGKMLYQSPAPGIEKYRTEMDPAQCVSKCFDVSAVLGEGGFLVFANASDQSDKIKISLRNGYFYVDTSCLKNTPQDERRSKFFYGEDVFVRILFDISSVEIFVDGGHEAFTERHFIESDQIVISGQNVNFTECYELNLPQENFTVFG